MLEIFSKVYFVHVAILLGLIVGLTLFKVADCSPLKEDGEPWDTKKFLKGIARHILAVVALSVVYVVGEMFGSDVILITVNSTELTIQAAIDAIMLAADSLFAVKFIKNGAEFFGFKGAQNLQENTIDVNFSKAKVTTKTSEEEEPTYLG